MKKSYLFPLLSILMLVVCSCSNTSSNVEYLPCKVEKKSDWGFVDPQGHVVCDDMFKNQPSFVRDGIFAVEEASDLYTLYAFDTKKPTIILEDLKFVGSPRDGLLPICKKDKWIEVIDTKGTTKFELNKIDGKTVKSCSPKFQFGYLIVETEEGTYGMVNTDGKLLLKTDYTLLQPLKKNYILAIKADGEVYSEDGVAAAPLDEDNVYMINENGQKYDGWKKEDLANINLSSYAGDDCIENVIVEKDDRLYIYDLKGEQVLKCPDRVKQIGHIKNKFFTYRGEDGWGVMNFKGERIVNEKYMGISILDDGFFALRDYEDNSFEFINKKGETIQKIKDYQHYEWEEGFGFIGEDKNECFILDKEFKPIHKDGFYEIGDDEFSSKIQSDFLDIDGIVESLVSAKANKLYDLGLDLGKTIGECDYLKSQNIKDFSYDYFEKNNYAASRLYKMDFAIVFDSPAKKEIYKDVQVEKYSYYYGYYYDTEKRFSHYELNEAAVITNFGFLVNVPKDKRKQLFNALCDKLEQTNTKIERSENSAQYKGNYKYIVNIDDGNIIFVISEKD